jgi:hypothetical protein
VTFEVNLAALLLDSIFRLSFFHEGIFFKHAYIQMSGTSWTSLYLKTGELKASDKAHLVQNHHVALTKKAAS